MYIALGSPVGWTDVDYQCRGSLQRWHISPGNEPNRCYKILLTIPVEFTSAEEFSRLRSKNPIFKQLCYKKRLNELAILSIKKDKKILINNFAYVYIYIRVPNRIDYWQQSIILLAYVQKMSY